MALFRRPAIFVLEEVDRTLFVEIVGVLSALDHKEEHTAEGYGANDTADDAAYDPRNITVSFTEVSLAREPLI